MAEIDLMSKYPKVKRDTKSRINEKTDEQIELSRKFGWEYFDKKGICYGGYSYDGRWIPVVKDFIKHYKLEKGDQILDVGCAKGYMIYDFVNQGIDAYGVDISEYAIDCAPDEIQDRLFYGSADNLIQFEDNEFDLVISINTIHNLEEEDCRKAVREIERVGKNAFIVVDSFRNKEEEKRMREWNLTGITVLSDKDWIKLFKEEGYTGDYYWFIP